MSPATHTMSLHEDKHPNKSSFFLQRKMLLCAIAAVGIALTMSSTAELVLKVSASKLGSNLWMSTGTYIRYPDGLMFVDQLEFSFFKRGDALLLASASISMAASLVAVITVFHAVKKGPWPVCIYPN
jgi:uncharacterized membrane protein YhhN